MTSPRPSGNGWRIMSGSDTTTCAGNEAGVDLGSRHRQNFGRNDSVETTNGHE